jgi:hypothetical protein
MTGTSCRQLQGELKFVYRESTVAIHENQLELESLKVKRRLGTVVAVFRGQASLFMETPEKYSSLETVDPLLDYVIINHKLSEVLLRPGSLKTARLYLCSTLIFIFYFSKVD